MHICPTQISAAKHRGEDVVVRPRSKVWLVWCPGCHSCEQDWPVLNQPADSTYCSYISFFQNLIRIISGSTSFNTVFARLALCPFPSFCQYHPFQPKIRIPSSSPFPTKNRQMFGRVKNIPFLIFPHIPHSNPFNIFQPQSACSASRPPPQHGSSITSRPFPSPYVCTVCTYNESKQVPSFPRSWCNKLLWCKISRNRYTSHNV